MQPPILFATAAQRGRVHAERWRGEQPAFCCVLGHTDTCLIPGISAAGVSEELRPLTPAADAEVLHLGVPLCLTKLPSNPSGAPGPSGITRAALNLMGTRAQFVGAGLRTWPQTECLRLSEMPGGNILDGHAVCDAGELFTAGFALGREVARAAPYFVIGESIPGGTTTALAVLLALGYDAEGRVSGSVPGNAHELKTHVARSALGAAGMQPGDGRADPLECIAQVGDPMQAVAAGLALGAAGSGMDVLLAGGSQMLTVAALIVALEGVRALDRIAIGTTRWIVQDPAADVAGLANDISPHLSVLAANLDFTSSRHAALHAYERGMVKEGVGAGGACIAACLATGVARDGLHTAIDEVYDALLGVTSTLD